VAARCRDARSVLPTCPIQTGLVCANAKALIDGQTGAPPLARAAIHPPDGRAAVPVYVFVPGTESPGAVHTTSPFTMMSTVSTGTALCMVSCHEVLPPRARGSVRWQEAQFAERCGGEV
jgi:hypothetical protein